jgi:hypothetical protein
MTTISKADKHRLTIPGIEDGRRYLVTQQSGGWWVQPEPGVKRPREWAGPKRDLTKHLEALAKGGLRIKPIKAKVNRKRALELLRSLGPDLELPARK